jgi:hypothetical protein
MRLVESLHSGHQGSSWASLGDWLAWELCRHLLGSYKAKGAVDQDESPSLMPASFYRGAAHANQEGGLWGRDENFFDVNRLGGEVFSRRREARVDRSRREVKGRPAGRPRGPVGGKRAEDHEAPATGSNQVLAAACGCTARSRSSR